MGGSIGRRAIWPRCWAMRVGATSAGCWIRRWSPVKTVDIMRPTILSRAILACEQSGYDPADHFIESNKMVALGSGAQRRIKDWHLSRYACYLIVQNADPAKPIVALGQTYFAVMTQRMEQPDELAGLT